MRSEGRKQELTNDESPGRAEWRSSVRATANYGIDVRHGRVSRLVLPVAPSTQPAHMVNSILHHSPPFTLSHRS